MHHEHKSLDVKSHDDRKELTNRRQPWSMPFYYKLFLMRSLEQGLGLFVLIPYFPLPHLDYSVEHCSL